MLEALVLDFDGLIIDSETAVAQAWREVFESHGHGLPDELWRSMVGTRENDGVLWAELERLTGERFDPEVHDPERRRRGVEIANELPPLPGVVALLDQAREAGLALAIASSSSCWWIEGHLARLGLAERFSVVRAKEDAPRSKPFPDIYLEAVRALGVDPARVAAFEDSAPGVAAAKDAGLAVIAIPGSYTEHMDFSRADLVLPSLDGVLLSDVEQALAARAALGRLEGDA